jgi:hypothetical protein
VTGLFPGGVPSSLACASWLLVPAMLFQYFHLGGNWWLFHDSEDPAALIPENSSALKEGLWNWFSGATFRLAESRLSSSWSEDPQVVAHAWVLD